MKIKVLWFLLFAVLLAGCDGTITITGFGESDEKPDSRAVPDCPDNQCPYQDRSAIEIPARWRMENYGGGSCNHASIQTVLNYLGYEQVAADWRKNYGGAAGAQDLAQICDRYGLRWAATFRGDADFLEWCSAMRIPAAIHWMGGAHAITFAGYTRDGTQALLVDNNYPDRPFKMAKAQFLNEWRRADRGCAIAPLGQPPPPIPWVCPAQPDKTLPRFLVSHSFGGEL